MSKIKKLDSEISKLEVEIANLKQSKDKIRANQFIMCGCGKRHTIKKLTCLQTHWYTTPHGCSGGDYWNEGELNFICPVKNVRNRLMFNNYDVEWSERRKYENDPAKQFSRKYKHLFKEVIDTHDDGLEKLPFWNNYYVDNRRKQFELVERKNDNWKNNKDIN